MKIRVYRGNNITFVKDKKDEEIAERGAGFMTDKKMIGLTRCPMCGYENYAMNVLTGKCTWCPFDANKISFE